MQTEYQSRHHAGHNKMMAGSRLTIAELLDSRRLPALLHEPMRLVFVEFTHVILAAYVQTTHTQSSTRNE